MSSQDDTGEFERHFDEEAWLDLSRGLASSEQAAAMERHLDGGCEECARRYSLWNLVVATARMEARYEPPTHAVEAVKEAFERSRKLRMLTALAEATRLIFDSFREPLPAGVRGALAPARHLLHEAGDTAIDLRLENEGGGMTILTGQVLNRTSPEKGAGGTRAILAAGDRELIAQTVANPLGEFQLEFEYRAGLRLYMEMPAGGVFSVELPELQS